ncbi:MAG: alpha/beta hydrolase [Methylocella sp.]
MPVLRWSLACFAAIYILMVVGLAVFQRRLQYFPDRNLADPTQAGMSGVEDLRLTTDDGETLVAWYVPAKDGHPLILYFHGNGGGLIDRVQRFLAFTASGYGLLAISYRGYGGSTGSPTQKGLMEDGETGYREARARGYDGGRIVLMGESLGTGVAIALAATHEAAALVLDSPFSSAVDVAAAHYPMFPVRWLMFDRFRSDLAIGNVHIPILVLHGDEDDVVPIRLARRLFDLANEPKTFMLVSGGKHLVLGLAEVFPRVRAWIDEKTGAAHRYGDARE